MPRHRKPNRPGDKRPSATPADRGEPLEPPVLRIIGGQLRGRKLLYSGEQRTRPMKDRVREAVFNLVGPAVAGKHAIDLFAGTGALGLEAISRGAARASLVEQHFPTANIIRQNAATLGVAERCDVHPANAFIWAQRLMPEATPWVVFCSPPYDFYIQRQADMLNLIGTLLERAAAESMLVVEADARFDMNLLPEAESWDVRTYPPAVVAIYRKRDAGV